MNVQEARLAEKEFPFLRGDRWFNYLIPSYTERLVEDKQRAYLLQDVGSQLSFPFREADELLVQQVDQDLLNLTPSFDRWRWTNPETKQGHLRRDFDLVFAVLKGKVVKLQATGCLGDASMQRDSELAEFSSQAEPVGVQLERLGIDPHQVTLFRVTHKDPDDYGRGTVRTTWTVYKP